jgi:hypothetical protein
MDLRAETRSRFKKERRTVKGLVPSIDSASVVLGFQFSCADSDIDSAQVMVTTWTKSGASGELEGLPQDQQTTAEMRFDGLQDRALLESHFSNETGFRLNGHYGYEEKGLKVRYENIAEQRVTTTALYIVDPDFAVRIQTEHGLEATAEFSLEEPSIKRLLGECGFTYGAVPPKPKRRPRQPKEPG